MASNRKKKEKKKDFVKPKLKVGKAAHNPANHTSTEFKAKRINITSSTKHLINHGDPTTEYLKKLSILRKVTANLNSRKEILAEFLDILKRDPFQETNKLPLDDLIKVIKALLFDQSKKIRHDARAILEELIRNHNNLIILNHDSIMLYVFSAMTHLKPTIRQDSILAINLIINGGEKLKNLTISNHWIRIWKNILVLMNWKKENKSYTDSNDFKDFNGMRFDQLSFISSLLKDGCFPREEYDGEGNSKKNREDTIQIHDLLNTYMIKPNMSMLYRNLKLFGNISVSSKNPKADELADATLCEDVDDRVKSFYEGFYNSVSKGISDFTKVDDNKLVVISNKILNQLLEIEKLYKAISD